VKIQQLTKAPNGQS